MSIRLLFEASKKLKSKAILIDSPAFPETKELKEALMANQFNQELVQLWQKRLLPFLELVAHR